MPDRRSFRARRCGVFAEPKNKREALIKAEGDAEYARFHGSPAQNDPLIAEARPNPMCSGCGKSDKAIRWGKAKSGLPRYYCKRCKKTFTPASGGLIDQRKLPLRTMVKFLVNVLTGTSVSGRRHRFLPGPQSHRDAPLVPREAAVSFPVGPGLNLRMGDDEVLLVDVDVAGKDRRILPSPQGREGLRHPVNGRVHRHLRRLRRAEGKGKSSSAKVLDAFRNHIKPGSTLIHDLGFSHYELIARLRLADRGEEAIYGFDRQSGLDPINAYCSNMEDFVRLHRGMNKHRLQGWMNLFAFKFGCPGNALQKAEKLPDLLLKCKETIRYRD